ncbi:hypothetical protein R6Q59_014387 [Mikania micrantha]
MPIQVMVGVLFHLFQLKQSSVLFLEVSDTDDSVGEHLSQLFAQLETLRKELDSLKDKDLKAEAAVKTVGKTYDEESRRERELQAQFRDADDVRQKAYSHLNSLKKLSYDKGRFSGS